MGAAARTDIGTRRPRPRSVLRARILAATYTRTSSWQDHAERWKGVLQPGMAADVCIVAGDVLGSDPQRLVDLPIAATVLGGRVVHRSGSSTKPTALPRSHDRVACLQGGKCCCQSNLKGL
ncbi:amidohydrolase family protein [Spirillospora sp. NPDC048911]|uniref:amidohydrolase family protein n=1 Tax=Spirillospora sp. NPDC048911 TaxID=3364527 RepID=UPI0037101EF8